MGAAEVMVVMGGDALERTRSAFRPSKMLSP
jgi:hypothetical protein